MLAAQGHNKGAGGGMGEQGHSKEPAHILIHHEACVQCYLYAAQIFPYPWCHHISLNPGAITPPQHSFFIFSPACFPSLLSQLLLPKVVTCQIRPTFSLILLRVGDLLLKQRCAEMWETLRDMQTHNPGCSFAGPKALGKLGYLKPMTFCSFSLACGRTNPAGSSWS